MREPARIPRILAKLDEIWKTRPDLRLGQLLVALNSRYDNHALFVEDEDLEKAMDIFQANRRHRL